MKDLIQRKVLISMLFLGLSVLGFFSYRFLPMELYPDAEYPTLNVTISCQNEMEPNYIRNKAVIPVEGVISSLEGVEEISTRISSTNARISISFSKNTNIKYAFLKLEEKVKNIPSLGDDFNVSVSKNSTGSANDQFMTLMVLSDEDIDYVRNVTDEEIASELEAIEGVAGVTVMGGRQKSIEIIVDEQKCEALNITPSRISSFISSNMAEKSFAGAVYSYPKRYFVNVTAEYVSTEDIGNIVVAEGPTLLSDIAEIRFGVKEDESYSRVNGKEVITCIVTKNPMTNIIELSERVIDEIDVLNHDLKKRGVEIKVSENAAEVMSSNIDAIMELGLSGAILAIFILYIFLRNLKIVSFVAFAIPISVLSSFYFFYFYGISINTLTLTGIALAVGMLLDNSVVVMENIFRLRSLGYTPLEAATKGTTEVWKSVVASTVTTITVFLPFLFAEDFSLRLIGEHVGISIISTLTVSLVVALLLIPMAVHWFMKRDSEIVNFSALAPHSRPVQIYVAILKMAMRRPILVIMSSIVLLVGTVALSLSLTLNTLKEVEADTFNLYMTFYSGNTLAKSDEMVRILESRLSDIPEIEEYSARVYDTDAQMTIKLKEDFESINDLTLAQVKRIVMRQTRGLWFNEISLEAIESSENFQGGGGLSGTTQLLASMGMGSQSEKIYIKGQDFEKMQNLGNLLRSQMNELDNISSTSMNTSDWERVAQIRFDQYSMNMYGVTSNDILNELRSFAPQTTTELTYKAGDQEYDIIIKDKTFDETPKEEREEVRTFDDLKAMDITTSEGSIVKLEQVAKLNRTWGKSTIMRVNQAEQVTLTYRFNSEINESKTLLAEAREEIDNLILNADIPTGIAVEVEHEDDSNQDDFTFLILAAFAIIYMILAAVFESLTAPLVLMFSIPLAAIGSLIILLITENSIMNANVMIGFIILIGIVVNNSIILIDYTSQLRKAGNRKVRALIIAGCSRLRPILITAITTIIAMLPLAMGTGEYVSGLGAPFAITVIGGLTMSTILTLVIVPTLYSGMEDALRRIRTQSLKMKIIQIAIIVGATVIIVLADVGLVMSLCYFAGVAIVTPLVTWFIEDSLKQANTEIISRDEEIHISIQNLVKIYGQPGEAFREWHSGLRIRQRLGIVESYRSIKDLRILLWLTPMAAFLVYFAFMYLETTFWGMFAGVMAWLACKKVFKVLYQYFRNKRYRVAAGVMKVAYKALYWGMPAYTIVHSLVMFDNSGLAIMEGTIWYIILGTLVISNRIKSRQIRPENIRGRYRKLKRIAYYYATKMPIIGIQKKPFKALNCVSLEIHPGMFGLLGPNGAGKTTLMRTICGIFEQSYGKIFINGIDTQEKREELQGLIGYLPQEFGTYENLSAWDYLDYQALLKGIYDSAVRKKRVAEVLDAVHMMDKKDKKIGGFSGGMKQRIGIAQTLLHLPRILVVDEPTAGLDPRERIRFRNLLVELSKNRIVIFSTHIIEDIASSCNQVGVISKGSLKYYGNPNDMVNIAKDVCWTFETSLKEFAALPKELLIVHHIRNGEMIRVRCLSETKPAPDAVKTTPVLEDSYLWLLRGVKIANNEELITGSGLNR